MVFFTCNACGQAVKKNQVEKHYTTKCRNCTVLSCIDCGKEFRGDEYQSHVKCISENEKYGGKDFKPKPSAAKGEMKQSNWISNIKNYIAVTNLPHKLSNLLNDLVKYDNIPRKKKSFQNFLSNSVRVRDNKLAEEAWEVFMKANQPDGSSKEQIIDNENKLSRESKPSDGLKENVNNTSECPSETVNHKKRKNKEEIQVTEESEVHTESKASKKHKKHHKDQLEEPEHLLIDNLEQEIINDATSTSKKSKKHKKKHIEEENPTANEVENEAVANGKTKKKHKKKRKGDIDVDNNSAEGEKSLLQSEDVLKSNDIIESVTESNDSTMQVQKKKKHKKQKNTSTSEYFENGDESTVIEEVVSKPKKTKHKSTENSIEENGAIQPANCEQEEENVPKKKKKKCK